MIASAASFANKRSMDNLLAERLERIERKLDALLEALAEEQQKDESPDQGTLDLDTDWGTTL